MQRTSQKFQIEDPDFLLKALTWANLFGHFAYYSHNNIPYPFGTFPQVLAIGAKNHLKTSKNSLAQLKELHRKENDWLFGYFAYDLKNEIEDLESSKPATIPSEHINFFTPEHAIWFESPSVNLVTESPAKDIWNAILQINLNRTCPISGKINIRSHTSKQQYLETVNSIKQQIVEGEYYEINYCVEFSVEEIIIDPIQTFQALNALSPMPFAALVKFSDTYIISASPERFLKKAGKMLISQPIKGTIRRGKNDTEDKLLKTQLRESEKERAENMMIVDLVRNDLAKSAMTGTVKVEELFGIYSFQRLHQMISTVSAISKDNISPFGIIENAFPMGSMTGAPKIRVMQEIEASEDTRRGIYSGALGYFTPDGDFDFSVIIRTLVYDHKNQRLSFHVGSAITYDADPELEYAECLLKAQTIFDWLQKHSQP